MASFTNRKINILDMHDRLILALVSQQQGACKQHTGKAPESIHIEKQRYKVMPLEDFCINTAFAAFYFLV